MPEKNVTHFNFESCRRQLRRRIIFCIRLNSGKWMKMYTTFSRQYLDFLSRRTNGPLIMAEGASMEYAERDYQQLNFQNFLWRDGQGFGS